MGFTDSDRLLCFVIVFVSLNGKLEQLGMVLIFCLVVEWKIDSPMSPSKLSWDAKHSLILVKTPKSMGMKMQ